MFRAVPSHFGPHPPVPRAVAQVTTRYQVFTATCVSGAVTSTTAAMPRLRIRAVSQRHTHIHGAVTASHWTVVRTHTHTHTPLTLLYMLHAVIHLCVCAGSLTDRCEKKLCLCDREAAQCLKRAPYNLKYLAWPDFLCGPELPTCAYY